MAGHVQPLAVTFLGCGKLSSAVLDGMLASLYDPPEQFNAPNQTTQVASSVSGPILIPGTFVACVHQHESAIALEKKYEGKSVTVLAHENVRGVEQSNVVIFGVEPSIFREVLAEPGMRDALLGKTMVSFVGGVTIQMLQEAIYGYDASSDPEQDPPERCQIMRVTPSTAAAVRESFTLVIEEEDYPYPPQVLAQIQSLLSRVGSVKTLPDSSGHIGATLSASSPAFFALALEGTVNGAIELGMDRAAALEMAAASMRGAADLVARGESPDEVRRKIATPGGSTAVGLDILKEHRVQQSMHQAIVKSAVKAGGLGQNRSES